MHSSKKSVINAILILLILAGVAAAYFYYQKFTAKSGKDDLNYKQTFKPEDFRPLPLSPQSIKNGRTLTVPILMYHHVGDLPKNCDSTRADLTVPTTNFEAEVKWLKDNGYTSISLENIYLTGQGKFGLPKKPVVFTFDDGYKDVFINAVPILKKYGFTGSFGIITKNPGTTQGTNVYASWNDIKNAQNLGNEIVSHTQNHFDGKDPKFSAGYIFKNLFGSVTDLNSRLGITTNILIYPYGHYTVTYLEQAKKAGFVMGITVHEGKLLDLDNLMEIPRVRVHGAETLDEFEKTITE